MPAVNANTVIALLAAFAAPAAAFFRLPCRAPIVVERTDPIVNPGKVAGHLHSIMGGNGFGPSMTYADTQASTCSSCAVTKDFSNYWVPTLFFRGQDGTLTTVEQNGGALIYYLYVSSFIVPINRVTNRYSQREDEKDPEYENGLLAFPEGFQMLAGNPYLRNYTDTQAQQAISFTCLGTDNAETHEFPNYNCPGGLRAQVFFPSCWDGVNLDSADHK
jgi:hypothetical protein